ncbi:MAG: RNA polymerase sigma factor [Pyrinomonadaceae bacterium]
MPDRDTDERLLERASSGDEAAFQVLYLRYRDLIFRFAYRLVGSAAAAEDVTHDCFLTLIKQPERFNPERASFRTYLYAIARNLSLKNFHNSRRESPLSELGEGPPVADQQQPVRQVLDRELSREVQRAVANLPPLQREALILFEYEELSLAEVAAIVDADVGTVKGRLFRARAGLRQGLAQYFNIGREIVTVGEGLK